MYIHKSSSKQRQMPTCTYTKIAVSLNIFYCQILYSNGVGSIIAVNGGRGYNVLTQVIAVTRGRDWHELTQEIVVNKGRIYHVLTQEITVNLTVAEYIMCLHKK